MSTTEAIREPWTAALREAEIMIARRRDREIELTEAETLSHDLHAFLRSAWPVMWPTVPFIDGWHVGAICEHLQAVSEGEIERLVIMVPPGSTKSSCTSIAWPAWDWTRFPSRRFLVGSYGASLANRLSKDCRRLIRSEWYQRLFSIDLTRGEDQVEYFTNTAGGRRYTASPGGKGGSGEHANIRVIDDPHDASKVLSEASRIEAIDWHDGTLSTRAADKKWDVEVIICQRLHEKDLAGHVLGRDRDRWTVLCLPERYEEKHPFVCPDKVALPSGREIQGDARKEEGALLCPARLDETALTKLEADLGPYRAAAQLQQRPAAVEGEICKRHWWRYFDRNLLRDENVIHLPAFEMVVQSWDTAFKEKTTSDFVVGQVWGVHGADRYLLRKWKDRMSFDVTKASMRNAYDWIEERWPTSAHWILIEKSANGVDIIAELKRELPGVKAITASTDKTQRLIAATPPLAAGNVYLPGAPSEEPQGYDTQLTPAFAAELIEDCAVFPHGDHDDDPDAFSQAMNWLRGRIAGHAHVAVPTGAIPSGASLDR